MGARPPAQMRLADCDKPKTKQKQKHFSNRKQTKIKNIVSETNKLQKK
jgi:hypothetical protein